MLYARVLRSPHPHANIRSIDVSKALAMPGVKAVITHENCKYIFGAGSIAGGRQYVEEVKEDHQTTPVRLQQSRAFRGRTPLPPLLPSIGTLPEEALQHITVEYEVLPFVLDQEEALKPGAPQIWPDGNISLDVQNEAKPMRREVAAAISRKACVFPTMSSKIATCPPPLCTTHKWNRALPWPRGMATSSRFTLPPAALPTAAPIRRATSGFLLENVRIICQ